MAGLRVFFVQAVRDGDEHYAALVLGPSPTLDTVPEVPEVDEPTLQWMSSLRKAS